MVDQSARPEDVHDLARMEALGDQERGARMPQIVEAQPGQFGGLQDALELTGHVAVIEGRTDTCDPSLRVERP